jgi:hypothetical protein
MPNFKSVVKAQVVSQDIAKVEIVKLFAVFI